MSYTFWHCGVLMGEADLERNPHFPRQIVGILRPTAYGRRLVPRLTGLLSAAAALKVEMAARGQQESLPEGAVVSEFIESSPGGQRLVDVGRALSEVELRDGAGVTLKFQSIAFVDLAELRSVARKLHCRTAVADLKPVPPDAPRVIVSATLAPRPHSWSSARRVEIT